jgi:hypothetical protein
MVDDTLDKLTRLVTDCERQLADLTDEFKVDTQLRHKKSKGKKGNKGNKGKHCHNNNPLYSLKHCLHTINTKTSELDNHYATCLLGAKSDNEVRQCFSQLQQDLNGFINTYEQECNVAGCKVSDISNNEVSCCVSASNLGELNNCFNSMIIGPLDENAPKHQ